MKHLKLLHQAKVAIDKVFDDSSVDLETVLGSLEELQELVEANIRGVQEDMQEDD